MKALYQEVMRRLDSGENVILATVFAASGSSPRSSGAKMAVFQDGSIIGTIGGGRLEGDAILAAQRSFELRQGGIQSFDLTSADIAGTDMVCGGKGKVLLNYIDAENRKNSAFFRAVVAIFASRDHAWLVTSLGDLRGVVDGRQWLVKQDGTIVGNTETNPDFSWLLTVGHSQLAIHAEMSGDQNVLVEPIRQSGTVFLFGAGHISRQIAVLCDMVGFQTVVLDDRSEFANSGRFPASDIILLRSFEDISDLSIDENSFIVIVTRGHLHDKTVLAQALRTNAAYIGMIGSRRKRDLIFTDLLNNGFTRQDIQCVFSPIGLAIGAETPEEIAVSVVGELIRVRAGLWRCGGK